MVSKKRWAVVFSFLGVWALLFAGISGFDLARHQPKVVTKTEKLTSLKTLEKSLGTPLGHAPGENFGFPATTCYAWSKGAQGYIVICRH